MNAFDLAGVSAPRPLTRWLPPVGGLLAAAAVALLACRLPTLHTISWGELLGSAIACVLEVLLACAVTVWGICALSPRSLALDTRRLILRTSLVALWIAPLALLIRENSPWAIVITAVLVASFVRLVRFPPDIGRSAVDEFPPHESNPDESLNVYPKRNPFRLLESAPSVRLQAFGGGAALCAEAGVGAAFAGYPFTAVALVAAASAVWTWSYTRIALPIGAQPYSSSRSSSRPLMMIALAIVITAAALLPYLPQSFGGGGFGAPSRSHVRRRFLQGETGGRSHEKTYEASAGPTTEGDPGIVLLPDKLTHTKLVAPPPIIANAPVTGRRNADPLVIPFDGVYWFFRAPDVHPPRSSRQAHGSPELLDIHSTDRRPLSMEAHENLGSLIDLSCCSKIQVAIRNADHYPETVSLELVLINTAVPGKPSQSLGRMMVKSTRRWELFAEPALPASETLNFVIPAKSSLRSFDAVRIVFRIDADRAYAGPKIAIDHLVLLPRGL
jgi:hypothetical protein